MIVVVDYGMGNLGSISNMFNRIGVQSVVSNDFDVIRDAEKLLLPGVGAFDAAMGIIRKTGLKDVLDEKVLEKKTPILGICLGMQLLTKGSDEGQIPGLGWIDAYTSRFPQSAGYKVPHMGWNTVQRSNGYPWTNDVEEQRFYFVHSYYVRVENEENSMLKTEYGLTFDSGICKDNIFGCQFHPEKSHKYGMQLLSWFARI
nr:imidazole glycerol phosphate synthase subunit HisH [uncultured Pseudodesulfovibrio sp.]